MRLNPCIFGSFFLFQIRSSCEFDGNDNFSLLRPKASKHSRSEHDLRPPSSQVTCPGQGRCMSRKECETNSGDRKMGLCPEFGEVCCKVSYVPPCGGRSNEFLSEFMTPDYPRLTSGSSECAFSVLPLKGVCALKFEVKDVVMAGSSKLSTSHKCVIDSLYVLGIPNGPTEPLCDLRNYSAILFLNASKRYESPVKFLFVIQSPFWKVHLILRQIACHEIQPWKNEPLCGRQFIFDSPSDSNNQLGQTGGDRRAENALIVNGKKARGHEFPWQVSIQTKIGDHRCGGSVIRSDLILTAAHCFHAHRDIDKMNVRLGTADGTLEGDEIEIASIIQNYEYKPSKTHLNDITVLKLKSNITYSQEVQPICLPNPDEKIESGLGLVSGWGLLSGDKNASSPDFLQKVQVTIISNTECYERLPDAYELALRRRVHVEPLIPSQLCAIAPKNSTICFGDSGGPLVTVNASDGTYRQVGIVSYGVGRCVIKEISPVIYSRVTEFLQFIAIAEQY